MDSENVEQGVSYSRRSYKRTFVYLDKEEAKATSAKRLEELRKGGRVADITFTRNDPPSHIGRLLIANFPLLVGIDLKSLTFFKSYQSGHSMAVVSKGLMDGNRLVEEYSASHRKKVYFISIPQASSVTCTITAPISQVPVVAQVDLTTSPCSSTGGFATHRLQTTLASSSATNVLNEEVISPAWFGQRKVQMLSVGPDVAGDVSEVLDFLGLTSRTKKLKSYVRGRTEEVALLVDKLGELEIDLPPCLTHSLDELLCQGVEDVAVCVLALIENLVSVEAKSYVRDIFRGLHQNYQDRMAFLFWLADSQSVEGVKVQSRFGVPAENTVLIVVPGHMPQCVEIFNAANYDRRQLMTAFQSAAELCQQLKRKRDSLYERRLLIKEQDQEFFKKEATPLPEEECDPEVTFGPGGMTDCASLENTIEDQVDKGICKKKKNKRKKKKNKKGKKAEPQEKRLKLENNE
ncbi:uncharacterized protein [Montipora capricornis]|uniref:uncharacterized protein isoform X2 n=1 Tax=Montipora capricornis TaxID=246305 RepID=UPI0035F1E80F